ncbi:MAG: hypothetical protein QXS41_00340 [Candidatus Woesearchaeota archaeon]
MLFFNSKMIQQNLEILKIKEIFQGELKSNENEPTYLEYNGKKIQRILVYGVIINKFETNYISLMIDDGTGNIEIRFFDNSDALKDIDIGDLVVCIGKAREFGKIYLSGETIQKIEDEKWFEFYEMLKIKPSSTKPEFQENKAIIENETKKVENKTPEIEEIDVEIIPSQTLKEKTKKIEENLDKKNILLELIRKLDNGSGADYESIRKNYNDDDLDALLYKLLESGDIYEFKPQKYKILD